MPTDKEQKKLERLLKLKSDSELAIFDEVQEIKDEVEKLRSEIPNLDAVLNSVKGQKGDPGEPGKAADEEYIIKSVLEQIPAPKDGKTPSRSELLALIKPLIPVVKDGKDGLNGLDADEDYIISEVLRRLPKPKDGKDGSPDTPEEIVTKLSLIKNPWLDAKSIKNLPQPVVNNYQSFIGRGGGASVGLETIKSSGTIVKQGASTLEFDSTFSVTPTVNGAVISAIGDGTGDVHGPASSTDNAIARFDGVTGKIIQDYTSGAPTISDTGDITLGAEAAHSITLGASTTLGASGGALTIASGDASSTTGSGGALVINSGKGGGTTGTAGAITIQPGTQTTGSAPALNLLGRSAASSGTGGAINITAGNASSSSTGGALTATGGAGASTSNATSGAGGTVTVTGNTGGSSSNVSGTGGAGGRLVLNSGTGGTASGATSATGGKGGDIQIVAKNGGTISGTGTAIGGAGGDISITAGNGATATTGSSNTAGVGGSLTFTSGNAGASGGNVASGNITFQTGTPVGTGTVGAHIFNVNGATEISRINGTGIGLFTNAPTHSLTLGSTSTGIALYNTADQTTNIELFRQYWSSNTMYLLTSKGGTGTLRGVTIGCTSSRQLQITDSTAGPNFLLYSANNYGASSNVLVSIGGGGGNATNSSGINTLLSVNPTLAQTGTAGYTALLINPTESSTGSGVKRLISAQVGSVDRFVVDNTGLQTSTQSTLGNAVQQLSTTATNDDPTELVYQNRVATTDATVTTIATIAIHDSTTVGIEARVTARRTGGAAGTAEDGAFYIVTAAYKNVAGTATEIGETAVVTIEDQAGWNATFTPSGGNALIQVTGAVKNNVTWHVTYRTYSLST